MVEKLLHYTVVPTQPWKNDDNPLAPLWMDCFRAALRDGAVSPGEVLSGIRDGGIKPSLADDAMSLPFMTKIPHNEIFPNGPPSTLPCKEPQQIF